MIYSFLQSKYLNLISIHDFKEPEKKGEIKNSNYRIHTHKTK